MATFTKLQSDSIDPIDPIDPIFKKTILQRRVGKNVSQVMWKTRCQLSQTLDWSCCCKGWHNQLLDLGGNYFFI